MTSISEVVGYFLGTAMCTAASKLSIQRLWEMHLNAVMMGRYFTQLLRRSQSVQRCGQRVTG